MRSKLPVVGILLIVGMCWFWYSLVGNPFDELALIRHAATAPASLADTWEDEQSDFRDHVYISDVGIYRFQIPDGREFMARARAPIGELRSEEAVEYLPDDPSVSRIKGDGCQSVGEWLWRKVGLGVLLLAMFVTPGIIAIRDWASSRRRVASLRHVHE